MQLNQMKVIMKFANDFAKDNGRLDVICIGQRGIVRRSDAFIIVKGGTVVLLDSGLPEVYYALTRLLELRAFFLTGHEDLLENKDIKLRITWIASHMHIDHIGAFRDEIAISPYIFVCEAYLPPRTEYFDSKLSPTGDGDFKYRTILSDIFNKYQSECLIKDIPFSNKETFIFNQNSINFTILPPTHDWGTPEYVALCKRLYVKENEISLPISIGNANSMWLLVEYQGRRFLFTGDSMKKTDENNESFDEMLSNWSEVIGYIDVIKYPHHGIERDMAAPAIISLNPGYVVCNAIDATGPKMIRLLDQEAARRMTFVSSSYEDRVFSVNLDGALTVS